MARTRQAARKSKSHRAPREQLATDTLSRRWAEPHAKLTHLPPPITTERVTASTAIYWKPKHSKKEYLIFVPKEEFMTRHVWDKEQQRSTFKSECIKPCITKYDVEEQKYIKMVDAPKDFEWFIHSAHFIDTRNDKLYIFSSVTKQAGNILSVQENIHDLLILNLNTNKWTILKDQIKFPESLNIFRAKFNFVNNECHILYHNHKGGHHAKYNFDEDAFVELENGAAAIKAAEDEILRDYYPGIKYSANCVYIEPLNQFVAIGHDQKNEPMDSLWILDLNDVGSKWMKSDIEWPWDLRLDREHTVMIKAFDSIIYIICKSTHFLYGPTFDNKHELKTWCLDIIGKKWYKSDKKLPDYMYDDEYLTMEKWFVAAGNRYLHFYYEKEIHDRIDLYDLAPEELKKMIDKRMKEEWKVYVFGFIKQSVEKKHNLNVPDYLKRIVLYYYHSCDDEALVRTSPFQCRLEELV